MSLRDTNCSFGEDQGAVLSTLARMDHGSGSGNLTGSALAAVFENGYQLLYLSSHYAGRVHAS